MPIRFLNLSQWTPMQLLTGIVTALITALLTFSLAWVHNISAASTKHEASIAVLDERTNATNKDIVEIKTTQRRMEDKLDRALERK